MISAVRSKVASKISKIKEADDFNFSNWLKKPLNQNYPIEELTSYLKDIEDIGLAFLPASLSQYTFDMFEPEVTDELKNCEFKKVRSNAIFFMIAIPVEKGIVYSNVKLKHKSFFEKKVEFVLQNPAIKKIQAAIDVVLPQKIEFNFGIPASRNYLSNLVAEIFKIDLLDFEDLESSAKKVKVENIKLEKFKKTKVDKSSVPTLPGIKKIFRVKVPSIDDFKVKERELLISSFSKPTISNTFDFRVQKVKTWFADFQIPKINSTIYFRSSKANKSRSEEENTQDKIKDQELREQLNIILGNRVKLDWRKSGGNLTKLSLFEEVTAKFLVETDYALLQDEFGIDIQKETFTALKLLFDNRAIRSALIITDDSLIGTTQAFNNTYLEFGWSNRLRRYCPKISFEIVSGNNDARAELWSKRNPIVISNMNTIVNDYRLKILEEKNLDKFDCIILESVDQLLEIKEGRDEFLSAIKPRILWATSNVNDKNLQNELNSLLASQVQIERVQNRSKQSIVDSLPKFIYNEFWSYADENQTTEFKTAITEFRKDLRRVLESGNPLRFYANIFTFFHKLNQIGNFASDKSESPKAELVLNHLSSIKKNGKKVLIISQYEKMGTKKIAELLSKNDIKFLVASNSLSNEEMQKSVSAFQSQSDIVAFVTDAKISKVKFLNFNVPYIIKFDQWWNPITNWELEDIFIKEESEQIKESINLCSYFVAGTLDQKIRELLVESGLSDKNLFELMPPKLYEELILVDEWLKIFGMPVSEEVNIEQTPEKVQDNLQKITIDAFRKLLTRMVTILGFSNVDILELPNSNSFNVIGKAQRNGKNFFLNSFVFEERKVEKKDIENILLESSKSKQDKIFIISRSSLPQISSSKLRDNVTILDGLVLSKLLIRLGLIPS